MERCRMVFSGSGGQGLVSAAIILAEAAVLYENLEAVQSQSYGAAARGGATRADVIIADGPINMPKITQPSILICMTQEAYTKFSPLIRPGGLLISDQKFVETTRRVDARQQTVPGQREVPDGPGRAAAARRRVFRRGGEGCP